LLLPYRGDGGELFMPRYAYFFLERPEWILDGYLVGKGDE
jgi:conjugal transfer pilus assembly protein TraV